LKPFLLMTSDEFLGLVNAAEDDGSGFQVCQKLKLYIVHHFTHQTYRYEVTITEIFNEGQYILPFYFD
jgi:hypothetical protein